MTATGAATRPPPPTTDVASSSFDIFLLVQTWYPYLCCAKPENCVLKPDSAANLLAIHGLWPSRSTGGFPTYCSLPNPRPKLSSDVSRLSRHEWKKHGTCSSMSPSAYFSATASSAPPPPSLILEATNGGKIAAVLKTDELRGAYPKKVRLTARRCTLASLKPLTLFAGRNQDRQEVPPRGDNVVLRTVVFTAPWLHRGRPAD